MDAAIPLGRRLEGGAVSLSILASADVLAESGTQTNRLKKRCLAERLGRLQPRHESVGPVSVQIT